MNAVESLFVCLLAVACVIQPCVAIYSNSLEVESVTTFADCNNATAIDPVTQAQVCIGNNNPITVIQYFVLPDQNDAEGGSGLEFYTYPQPFTNKPVNQQNGAPSDNPCQQASATTNCTYFETPGTNDTGAIQMTVKVSNVVRKYKLVQVLDKKTVPYSYLNYAATVPKCPENTCANACYSGGFNTCDPSTKESTDTSFFACCAIQRDYTKYPCGERVNKGQLSVQGDLFGANNELYKLNSAGCGSSDSYLLFDYGTGVTKKNASPFDNTGGCRVCTFDYNYQTQAVANRGPKTQGGGACPEDKDKKDLPKFVQFDLPYPTTMPDLCPVPLSHAGGYPATTGDRESGANADGYAAEPYFYWCQANCVGTASYSSKYLKAKDASHWHQYQEYCDLDNFPRFEDAPTSRIIRYVSTGGEGQDMYNQFQRAYDCGIDTTTCPQLQFAANVIDSGAYACCNTTYNDNGILINNCGSSSTSGDPGADIPGSCGGIAAEQVNNAISYLTAACNAEESGESICGHECVDEKDYSLNVQWTCPGSKYDHISPGVVSEEWLEVVSAKQKKEFCKDVSCQSTYAPDATLSVAKCSAECSSDPFIRFSNEAGKDCHGSKCKTSVESLTSQKAIVGLGGPSCKVYQVVPQPILDVSIDVTFTDPSGNSNTTRLSTDGSEPAFGTTYLDNVAFSTRVNQVYSVGSTGPQIPGYLVVCGMNQRVDSPSYDDSEPCIGRQGTYNPYDPEEYAESDPDISVEKPSLTGGYCQSADNTVQFRGIFPGSDPHTNPWPQLIRKMVQSRTLSNDPIAGPSGLYEHFDDEAYACAVPTARYYGVLNCGKPVYYYYVPEERKSSYGLTCGTLGVQNNFVQNPTNARTVCLQDQNSCTPGYGLPKFTSGNAPFYQSPCQELGNMVKEFRKVFDTTNDQSINVCDGTIPQAWNLPGFRYLKNTDQYTPPNSDSSEEVDGVPNTWLHEGFLYQQLAATEQQEIRFDMSTYTDTFFGGSFQTYTNGIIVLDQDNTTVCVATIGSQPGLLVVGVENTNLQSGGTYSLEVYCVNPADNSNLTSNTQGATLGPDGSGVLVLEVGAGKTEYVNWGISAGGYIPSDTDTDTDDVPDDQSIGFPTCIVTLYTGAIAKPTFQISQTKINCNLLALNIIQNQKSTNLLTSIETSYNCGEYSFIVLPFCWIGNMGPIESSETIFIFFLIGIACALLGYFGLRDVRSRQKLEAVITEFTIDEHEAELAKERRQALATQSLVKRTITQQNPPTT